MQTIDDEPQMRMIHCWMQVSEVEELLEEYGATLMDEDLEELSQPMKRRMKKCQVNQRTSPSKSWQMWFVK